jgi:hypothetical protein
MLQVSLPAFQAVLSVRGWGVVDAIGHPLLDFVLFTILWITDP